MTLESGDKAPFSGDLFTPSASIQLLQESAFAQRRIELAVTATSAAWRVRLEAAEETAKVFAAEQYAIGLKDGLRTKRARWFESKWLWGPLVFVAGGAAGYLIHRVTND